MNNNIIITNDGSHSIYSEAVNENYHSKFGSIAEAEHVFIKNGFLAKNQSKLKILELGFGTGLNALLTLQKAKQKDIYVDYHTIELYPILKNHYMKLNFSDLLQMERNQFLKLHECGWEKENIISSNFKFLKHNISFEKYNTNIKFDIVYFDAFSPNKQPELWNLEIFKKIFNLLVKNGILVTYCAKGSVKRIMKKAGLDVIVVDGPPGKRQMTKAIKSTH